MVVIIYIGKFIKVIKEHDTRGLLFCFLKCIGNFRYKFGIIFVVSNCKAWQIAFFDEAFCYKRFAETGLAIEQHSAYGFCTECYIALFVIEHIAYLNKPVLD